MRRITASITTAQLVRLIPWAPVALRLLLAAALFESQISEDGAWANPSALVVLSWGAASLASVMLGHLGQRRTLQLHFGVDCLAATIAVVAAPETMLPAVALLLASFQMLTRAGFSAGYAFAIIMPLAIAPIAAGMQTSSLADVFGPPTGRLAGQIIMYSAMISSLGVVALSTSRGDQIRQFGDVALSIRMLKLEKSMEFDLQQLVDGIANLFPAQRAMCFLSAASQNAGTKRFIQGPPLQLDAAEIQSLMNYGASQAGSSRIFENNARAIIDPANEVANAFGEDERKLGFYLAREGIGVALCQPFRIGRSHGMLILALPHCDAIIFHEVRRIGEILEILFAFLDSVAEAERHFIADAHDVARRDLHDGVLQTLAAVRMRLLTLSRRSDVKEHAAQVEIQKVADILTVEQARLRGLLETSEDEDHGINLVTRLDVELRTISMQWDIDARLEAGEPAIPIDKEGAINIEHLVREAVANAVRHAKSTQLTVRLSLHHNELRIVIVDRNEHASLGDRKKGKNSMPLRSASLLHRLRLVNGSAYADGLESRGILAISIPMQRTDNA